MQSPKPKPNLRTPDFRYVYSNAFGIQLTSNEMMINFGISEDVSRADESVLEQTGIVLNLSSAKLLSSLIDTVVRRFEADSGIQIPLDAERLEAIANSMTSKIGDKKP